MELANNEGRLFNSVVAGGASNDVSLVGYMEAATSVAVGGGSMNTIGTTDPTGSGNRVFYGETDFVRLIIFLTL